jgi:hypothetical protein
MQYHQPDERWSLFGCSDYNDYLKKFMVTGRFHEGVPEDVKKSYETIEQLIAHAWYHYPMYDEALNKLLRTFEIAVKQKGKEANRELAQLIKTVCEHEPHKRLSLFLNYLRDLRNHQMHPEKHSFAGGIMYEKIRLTVNIINVLFATESFIKRLNEIENKRRTELAHFSGKSITFIKDNICMLIHELSFGDIFEQREDEVLMICLEPVKIYTEEQRIKKSYPR